jgi:hypothetical protein
VTDDDRRLAEQVRDAFAIAQAVRFDDLRDAAAPAIVAEALRNGSSVGLIAALGSIPDVVARVAESAVAALLADAPALRALAAAAESGAPASPADIGMDADSYFATLGSGLARALDTGG